MIYQLLVLFILFPLVLSGQEESTTVLNRNGSNNIGDCSGAITIGTNESINAQFTGSYGDKNDFEAYNSLNDYKESNSLWFRCETDLSGFLSITLDEVCFPFSFAAFLIDEDQDCDLIHNGILRPIQYGQYTEIRSLFFLLDSIQVSENEDLLICINSLTSTKSNFSLITSFDAQFTIDNIVKMKKVYDLRSDQNEKAFNIKIRDADTDLPVVAKVIISETRSNNALYSVSDFVFPYADNLRMHLKIDANGYYFKDTEISLRQIKGDEQVVYLERIERDQLIELEDLGFVSQSSILLPEAYPKIRRLKDFMAINPDVKIEVQGHVHLIGRNAFRAKLLSRQRAKKVRDYLIDSGVEKSRIDIKGYGNSKMKYPEAETDAQIQANRRVEIRIK